jgi:hypothetical protein
MAGRNLTDVIDVVGLIPRSSTWTNEDQSGMKSWFSKYLNWLLESRVGKEESQKMNNHGTYYYVQVAAIALFTYKPEIARDIIQALVQEPSSCQVVLATDYLLVPSSPEKYLKPKIQPDGHQPFELERSNSLQYSMFNLYDLFRLADLARILESMYGTMEVQTFFQTLLQKVLDFLLPYITKTERWPYSQVTPISRHIIAADLLCHAAVQYPRNSSLYAQIYRSLVDDRPFLILTIFPA